MRPLYDALTALSGSDPLRLHMPGHKGRGGGLFSQISAIDFTELPPTGNLYAGDPPIAPAEDLCARFAGAGDALFFSCGSTQGIYTMLAQAVGLGGHLILDRGCHKSVYQAMALLDITPHYLFPEALPGTALSGPVTAALLETALAECPAARAVFLTSPSYYGVRTDLAPLAALCRKHGRVLLVDQAHGAHFPAVGLPSAAAEGADLSVVSAHKTWPALGSSSILYVGNNAPFEKAELKETAALFGTTSPSYPILASIDFARDALEGEEGTRYRRCAEMVKTLRQMIDQTTPFRALTEDICLLDPCRLTVDVRRGGLSGDRANELLQKQNIFVEMSDQRYLVMILTCRDTRADLQRLYQGLLDLVPHCEPSASIAGEDFSPPPRPISRLSPQKALFGPKEYLPLEQAVGRISAGLVAPYPPGVPVLAPGEEITQKHIAYLQKKRYNIGNFTAVVSESARKE